MAILDAGIALEAKVAAAVVEADVVAVNAGLAITVRIINSSKVPTMTPEMNVVLMRLEQTTEDRLQLGSYPQMVVLQA